MKKTAIALAVAGLAAASVAQAAPQENTFYAGAKAGWASFHDGFEQFEDAAGDKGTLRNSVTYGIFGGYQILNRNNFGLAVELGYDDFGRAKARTYGDTTGKMTNHGAHLSIKPSYEVLEGLDVYGRVGAALIRTDYKAGKVGGEWTERAHSFKVSPVFAAGLEYAIPGLTDLALRLEYQWVQGVGKDNEYAEDLDFTPNIGSVSLGLSYRFGQGAPVAAPIESKTFSLSSDVLFNSAKYNLKPEAAATLDGVYGEIAQVTNPQVSVAGYADRMGKEAYNLKLSQRRAETVANYLVSKGVDANAISATGYGEANPVTGNTCDAVKGRKALIACLAPDRRVEITLNGSK
ncbi:OOP family OmpA-OmpF porin [Cricetibacter osteomyelitidis]|uniref:Outer membrane protein A n=1 Tax=Cricetibacter osteomyelitidis TaxID=1521931 RepID=A0A4V6NSA3_9PAST|nr:porin OmpA [Cricetibacter osteomyelitidis]TCP97683.1 OOP family OmpA-OmpF porin [Cricetibacter osteomyelitidis]